MSSISFDGVSKIIKAGAGAGKTTDLVNLFILYTFDFKKKHNRWPRIVITTFTRKATQEVKERILHKIVELQQAVQKISKGENLGAQNQIFKELLTVDNVETLLEDLFYFANRKSFVQISTIHGSLSLYLRRVATAIDMTPDFQIISSQEKSRSEKQILKNILVSDSSFLSLLEENSFLSLHSSLNKYFEQYMFLGELSPISNEGLLDLYRQKASNLISQGLRWSTELLQSTNNEKWLEYAKAVNNYLVSAKSSSDLNEQTETLKKTLTLKKPPYLSKSADFDVSLADTCKSWVDANKKFSENISAQMALLPKHQELAEIFLKVATEYCTQVLDKKISSGLISMSDLEMLSLFAMKKEPQLTNAYSLEWDFWMVDEYQDTSPVQVQILRALVGNRPCYYVGDPQQSIYLFRGARTEVFQDKILEVQASQGIFEEKLDNYRSNRSVLEFINEVFTAIDSKSFSKMKVTRSDQKDSLVSSDLIQLIITPKSSSSEDEDTSESGTNDLDLETRALGSRVLELISSGAPLEEICILVKTNKDSERAARVLSLLNIPMQIHGAGGLFRRREIVDLLALLKFLLNPFDNINVITLLRSPWFYVEDKLLVSVAQNNSQFLWKQISKELPDVEVINLLSQLLDDVKKMGVYWTLVKGLKLSGFFDYSIQIDPSSRREANIWKILGNLSQQEKKPGFNWLQFVAQAEEQVSGEVENEDGDAVPVIEPKRVNIMTVHASKGLQFAHILLPFIGKKKQNTNISYLMLDEASGRWTLQVRDNMTGDFVSSIFAQELIDKLREREDAEAQRVLYVALTRAKESISLIYNDKAISGSWARLLPTQTSEGEWSLGAAKYMVRLYQDTAGLQGLVPLETNKQDSTSESFKIQSTFLPWWTEGPADESSITDFISAKYKMNQDNYVKRLSKAQAGTEAHAIFEALKYQDIETVQSYADSGLHEAIDFIQSCNTAPLYDLVRNGNVEFGFAFRHKEKVFQGQIDLWAKLNKELWILDYKTGSSEYSEQAFDQLSFYHIALNKLKLAAELSKVNLLVVYPFEKKVIHREQQLSQSLEIVAKTTGIEF